MPYSPAIDYLAGIRARRVIILANGDATILTIEDRADRPETWAEISSVVLLGEAFAVLTLGTAVVTRPTVIAASIISIALMKFCASVPIHCPQGSLVGVLT